jgi:hypothetical protein
MRADISPLPGTKVQEIVQKLYATPKEIIERGARRDRALAGGAPFL